MWFKNMVNQSEKGKGVGRIRELDLQCQRVVDLSTEEGHQCN